MRWSSQSASRALISFSALVLGGGGVLHAVAFRSASMTADQSTLPAFFVGAFKGLWLCDSASSFILAVVFVSIAARPDWAGKPLLLLLASGPIAFAAIIFATMGNFFAGYLMLTAGAAVLLGAGLHQHSRL
jgi:hypothetical protein